MRRLRTSNPQSTRAPAEPVQNSWPRGIFATVHVRDGRKHRPAKMQHFQVLSRCWHQKNPKMSPFPVRAMRTDGAADVDRPAEDVQLAVQGGQAVARHGGRGVAVYPVGEVGPDEGSGV